MAEERTLDALLPSEGTSDFQIELARLSAGAQQQARDVVEEAAANGTLNELNLADALNNARDADAARENAEDLQVEQAKATADGDFERAEDLSVQAEYELRVVEDKGDEPVHAAEAIEHADQEQSDLQYAEYHAEIANENADSAAAYAATGDLDHAADYSQAAVDHSDAANDHAGAGDTVVQAEQHDVADVGAE